MKTNFKPLGVLAAWLTIAPTADFVTLGPAQAPLYDSLDPFSRLSFLTTESDPPADASMPASWRAILFEAGRLRFYSDADVLYSPPPTPISGPAFMSTELDLPDQLALSPQRL